MSNRLRRGKRHGKAAIGGRKPLADIEYFSPNDSNTIDDITGFKTKFSKMQKTWDGWWTGPKSWYYRNPQDFPVTAQRQIVYKDARSEQANPSEDTGTDAYNSSDYSAQDYDTTIETI
jgi:hypothetical protein